MEELKPTVMLPGVHMEITRNWLYHYTDSAKASETERSLAD